MNNPKPTNNLDEQWFALQVKARHERAISENLQSKGYEAFAPTRYIRKNPPSKIQQQIETPLFPGYTFVKFDPCFRLPILMTPGVRCVVGFGRVPTPVDAGELNAIREVLQTKLPVEPCQYIAEGTRVRIVGGSLAGVTGILIQNRSSYRVILSVCLIRQSIRVEVDRELLEIETQYGSASRLGVAS